VGAVAAIALGIWATSLSRDLGAAEDRLALLSDPNARMVATANGEAQLVVAPTGKAALVVHKLAPAPRGRDYEIWVFENGVPKPAGLFEKPGVAMLSRRVEPGQTVAVTLEPDGGVDAPTGKPLFTASA
jgi:anti-sigma-K factor RskA